MGWTSPEYVLPETRAFPAASVWGNWLVVAAGSVEVSDPVTTYRKSVIAARIGPGGMLGQWKTIAVLPVGRVGSALWISPTGKLYIFGGSPLEATPDAAMLSAGRDVLVGQLNPDGDLQAPGLVAEQTLPHALNGVGVAASRDWLYLVGGQNRRISLNFKGQTGNFTLGDTVTGKTSGATGVLQTQTDGGATGTLNLTGVVGTFQNDEVIDDQHYGSAVVNGTLGASILLAYDAQAVAFVVTDVIYGRTSHASGTIGVDSGTVLTLTGVSGTFADDEKLAVRMAKADGVLSTNYFLNHDGSTGGVYSVSGVVQGVTSGALGTVVADVPGGGADGVLEISSVSGDFQNNESLALRHAQVTSDLSSLTYLDYDAQTADFTVNDVIHGVTSGGVAVVDADSTPGSPSSGALTLSSIVSGPFANNEKLAIQYADSDGGLSTNYYLDFDNEVGTFTVGQTITGAAGATAVIVSIPTEGGGSGTLEIDTIGGGNGGVFVAGEAITQPDPDGGGPLGACSATVVAATTQYKTLNYDGQVKLFTASQAIQSLISGGTGTVMADNNAVPGVSGTLKVKLITGTFPNNERIVTLAADADGTVYKTLVYKTDTVSFIVGQTVLDLATGAQGIIQADANGGATGTLKLNLWSGTFTANDWLGVSFGLVDLTQFKTLLFKDQTKNFSLAQTLRGQTSGATGVLQAQTDGGATGTLSLKTISGAFSDGEFLLVDHADANGTQYQALGYDGQTGNFSVGDTVVGLTSAGRLTILTQTDGGATGTFAGDAVVGGPFVDDEDLQGVVAGAAVADGAPALADVLNSTVYRARIFADGSLGAWESIGVLPAAVTTGPMALAVHGDNLYWQSEAVLYWARATGERLDAWQSAPAAASRTANGLAVINDRLFVVGGDSSGEVATVYVMPLNSTGPNGLWFQTAALPVALKNFGLAVSGALNSPDRLWVLGGISTTAQAGVVTAAVDGDGRVAGEKLPV